MKTELPIRQHIFASGLIFVVSLWVLYTSFTAQPSAAFLFPRILSVLFSALALWTFAKAVLGRTKVGAGLSVPALRNITPGLLISIVYVFWLAKALGFYTATTLSVFAIISIYDPHCHRDLRSWVMRAVITISFMLVMWVLFSKILSVYTPKEVLFN